MRTHARARTAATTPSTRTAIYMLFETKRHAASMAPSTGARAAPPAVPPHTLVHAYSARLS